MNILIIEDDQETADNLVKGLTEAGHRATACYRGDTGLQAAFDQKFDVAVIDRMLPELDGLGVIARLRAARNFLPVLILSALSDIDERIAGLSAGGDDYLVKPFSFNELLTRLTVLIRRQNYSEQGTHLMVGELHIDKLARTVHKMNTEIELKPREFRLLSFLAENQNVLVSRDMLLKQVWDYDFDPSTNVVEVHISKLRNKIDKPFASNTLLTVRGKGYVLNVDNENTESNVAD